MRSSFDVATRAEFGPAAHALSPKRHGRPRSGAAKAVPTTGKASNPPDHALWKRWGETATGWHVGMAAFLFTPRRFEDSRGWFSETYSVRQFRALGMDV